MAHNNPKYTLHSFSFLKLRFSFFVLFFICGMCGFTQNKFETSDSENDIRWKIIKEAEKYIGKKYKCKMQGQTMDCSGFTKLVMTKFDIHITRSSVTQVKDGIRVKNIKDVKPGDILVFKGRNHHNNLPGHVGIAHHWSKDTLYFIHSSVNRGITLDHMYQPYYSRRFIQARNVIDKNQP